MAGVLLPKHPSAVPLQTAGLGAAPVCGASCSPCFDPDLRMEAGASEGALRMVPGRGVPQLRPRRRCQAVNTLHFGLAECSA